MNSCSCTQDALPALDHLYVVLLVGNNTQLCQGLKQVVALQDQIPLKERRAAQSLREDISESLNLEQVQTSDLGSAGSCQSLPFV